MKKEEKAYIEDGLRNGSIIRESDLAYADVDSINVREKAVVPELETEKYAQDPSTMELEKCCGNCAWFYGEDTDGWGQCINQDLCDSMNCSDICTTDKYVSKKEMRHHMAVLLQFNRYRRDNDGIYQCPNPTEIGKAIDFAVEYMKVFSEL